MSAKAVRTTCTPKSFFLGSFRCLKSFVRSAAYLAAVLGALPGILLLFQGGQFIVSHVFGVPLESNLIAYSRLGPVWSTLVLLCTFWAFGLIQAENYSLKRSFIGTAVSLVAVPALVLADKYLGWAFSAIAENKGFFWHPALDTFHNLAVLPVELLALVCLGAPLLLVGAFLFVGFKEGLKSICAKGQEQLSDDSLRSNR